MKEFVNKIIGKYLRKVNGQCGLLLYFYECDCEQCMREQGVQEYFLILGKEPPFSKK